MNSNNEILEPEMTLADFLSLLLRGWKITLLTTFFGSALGYVAARWAQPIYQADALIQIDTDSKGGFGGQLGELEEVFGASSKAETEAEILQSRMVLQPVVDTLGLMYSATPTSRWLRFLGRSGRVDLAFLDLPDLEQEADRGWMLVGRDSTMALVGPKGDSISQIELGKSYDIPYGESDTIRIEIRNAWYQPGEPFQLDVWDRHGVADGLYATLGVAERGKKTGILELSYSHRYPDQAAAILNEIARSYMRQNIDAKSAEAQKTLGFLKQQLPAVKAKLDSADAALNNYRLSRGTIDLSAEAKVALDQQVVLGQQLLELQQRKQELSRLYEEKHPQVAALNGQIGRIQQNMGKSSGKVRKLPQTQQEVVKLTRDVTVATEFYQTMLDKIQQLEVVRAGEVGSARIIDLAVEPNSPIKPNRMMILLMGVFGGFAVGFGFLLVRKVLDKGVRDVVVIEKLTQTSVFAQIAKSGIESKQGKKAHGRQILSEIATDDLAVESLRNLRTALEFSLLAQGGKVLGVSGLTPGVGKTFVSANLSALFAMSGKSVLLIDADFRKGRIQEFFDGQRAPGVTDLMSGRANLEQVLRKGKIPGLTVVTTGALPPNPAEMLGSQQFGTLVQGFRQRFDLVIIDTSPVLLVTDPALVFRHCDFVALVLKQGEHHSKDIVEGIRLAKAKEDLPVCLALNQCQDGYDLSGKYRRYGKYASDPSERVG